MLVLILYNALALVEEDACCGKDEQGCLGKAQGVGIDAADAGITQVNRDGNEQPGNQQEPREEKAEFLESLCRQNFSQQPEGLGYGGKEHDVDDDVVPESGGFHPFAMPDGMHQPAEKQGKGNHRIQEKDDEKSAT